MQHATSDFKVRSRGPPGVRSSCPEEGRWRRNADDAVEADEEEKRSTRLCRAGGGGGGGGGGWDGGRLVKGSSIARTKGFGFEPKWRYCNWRPGANQI